MRNALRLTRDNPVTLETRDAAMRPRTFDATANTIEAVIATDAPVSRRDARGALSEILDPAGADLNALRGASVLDSHQQSGVSSILGTVDEAWLEGNRIIARIRFSDRLEIAPVIADIRSGVINSVSIGYEVTQWRDGTDASGQRTRTAVKWTPREVSFVPVPADPNARTRGRDVPGDRATINRSIRDLGRRAGAPVTMIDDLIDRNATVEEARNTVLFDMLDRGNLSIRSSGRDHNMLTLDNPEVMIRTMAEALYTRVDPHSRPSEAARQFVGLSIPDLARTVLQRNGISTTGMGANSLITRALHTTSDFALILADTVGRTLRVSYQAAPSGLRTLARETTAPDFRKKSRLMLDSLGMTLEKVGESGEFKSGTMAEAGESYRVETFGKVFGISRPALVNDDLGAFTDVARRLGQAAAAFEAQFLVNLLIANAGLGPTMSDTKVLFHVDHGNISGTGAAPSETTLSAARLAMRKQTGPSGGLISVTPKYLLAPPDMETACEKLLTQIEAVTVDDVNPFSRLSLVIEPRLTDAKRWYLAADPAEIDCLEYAYLAGAPGPQIESQAGFRVDGVEIKVRLDYGAGFIDWRGIYTNAGQ